MRAGGGRSGRERQGAWSETGLLPTAFPFRPAADTRLSAVENKMV